MVESYCWVFLQTDVIVALCFQEVCKCVCVEIVATTALLLKCYSSAGTHCTDGMR
jgi:hypothetical protein